MALNLPMIDPNTNTIQNKLAQLNELQKQSLENRYYAPNIQSEIAQRQAATNHSNTLLPLDVQNQKNINAFYGPNMQSLIANRSAETNKLNTMTPLEVDKLKIENSLLPQKTQSEINSNNAMASWRNMGGANASVNQKDLMAMQAQIMKDNPGLDPLKANQYASAAIDGLDKLPNGEKVPPLSGIAREQLGVILRRPSTAAIQNTAANMDILASDLNDIDIAPIKKFAGIKGKVDYGKYVGDMAAGRAVPQEFRDYLAFRDVTSNFAMDALRKGFGTSVVPGYVYATLGKASNPNSKFWFDPEQVDREWQATTDWINKTAKKYKTKSNMGATADVQTPKISLDKFQGQEPPVGSVWMKDSQGNKYPVHETQIENGKKRGLILVG